MSFPYTPRAVKGGTEYLHVETGEILFFDHSWLTHLDDVERILMDNHNGNFMVIWP